MPTGKDILVMSYRLSTFLYGSIVPEIEVQIHAFLYQKCYFFIKRLFSYIFSSAWFPLTIYNIIFFILH